MGAILEETLAQVERWHDILGGIREAEAALDSQTAADRTSFDPNAFVQVCPPRRAAATFQTADRNHSALRV